MGQPFRQSAVFSVAWVAFVVTMLRWVHRQQVVGRRFGRLNALIFGSWGVLGGLTVGLGAWLLPSARALAATAEREPR